MRLSAVFPGQPDLWEQASYGCIILMPSLVVLQGGRGFLQEQLGLMTSTPAFACMARSVLLCADWMIRQLLCRGNSRRCWSTSTRQTSP